VTGQIHHVYGVEFRNAACEQISDCKESNNPFGEYIKDILKSQNCGINKNLEEFIQLDNTRNMADN
jgi:hypothetical protein